jgi:ADP-ribose pyrophosphatase
MENKWKILESHSAFSSPFMRLVADHCKHTERELEHTFYRFEFKDWVNIVPVTPEGEVVLVSQHRWGADCVTLEVPGGTLDTLEEEPLAAVRRELLEETGFDCEDIIYMGNVQVNPAIQNNHCHFFLALGATKQGEQELDSTEDITVELRGVDEIIPLIQNGTIRHSLAIQSLLYALLSLGSTAEWPKLKKY